MGTKMRLEISAPWLWALGAVLGILVSAACLWALPARSSQFMRLDVPSNEPAPTPTGFTFGPLVWDMRLYENDPALEPLRTYFRAECGESRGLEAALCLANRFMTLFPFGPPKHEFLDSKYDLISDFEAHVHGEPGHCVTRSGLITAILLANAIPARQLQVLLTNRLGHNVLEVWDGPSGWIVVDPSFGRIAIDQGAHPTSLVEAMFGPDNGWKRFAKVDDNHFYATLVAMRSRGSVPEVIIPEPWLYMRTGNRLASWPFRGLFVHMGSTHYLVGPAQFVLRFVASVLALFAIACVLLGVMSARQRAAGPSSSEARSIFARLSAPAEVEESATEL